MRTLSQHERWCPVFAVGVNPRMEAPVINARIRKSVVHAGLRVALLGPQVALNYPHQYLGNSG